MLCFVKLTGEQKFMFCGSISLNEGDLGINDISKHKTYTYTHTHIHHHTHTHTHTNTHTPTHTHTHTHTHKELFHTLFDGFATFITFPYEIVCF